jgi:hypothetical protein
MILKSSKLIKTLLAVSLGGLVSACTSLGSINDPIERKFQWFSYMEGGDIRAACALGAPSRYRLVYNGVYMEQVRAYDLGPDAVLSARVIGPANVRALMAEDFGSLLDPWRGKAASRQLSMDEMGTLVSALDQDGAFGPPAVGTELSSRGFFWTIAACHEGRYHFTGLAWPSPRWDDATFDDVLFTLDPSPIAVNPPRKTRTSRIGVHGPRNNDADVAFRTGVGEQGLVSITDLFR